MKKKELFHERGLILDLFVSAETLISMIIAQHYFKDSVQTVKYDFQFFILENPNFSWRLKRETLAHILRKDNLDATNLEDLDRINSIRNIFAHRQFVTNDSPQTPESEIFFTNPKHPFDAKRNIFAENIKNEFYSLFGPVLDWLYVLAQTKGVQFAKREEGII
jgi:hypothetical protein